MKPRFQTPRNSGGVGNGWPDEPKATRKPPSMHQHQAEGQQQAVNRIEPIDAAQKQPLEQHAEQAHHNRGTRSEGQ